MLAGLPAQVRDAFATKGVMYIRNYRDELGLPWQTAFQTDDREAVEERFRREDMDFEWTDGGGLRVRHLGPGVIAHPATGETIWFNQADQFHTSGLGAEVRRGAAGQLRRGGRAPARLLRRRLADPRRVAGRGASRL